MDSLCGLFGKSRQAYYRQIKQHYRTEIKTELILRYVKTQRKLMPKIGARKLHYLIHNHMPKDLHIGRDRLFELLREHDLLVKRRRYRAKTTYSNHWLHKYPNLIKDFIPTGPHQLWVSDITYILTNEGFLYLYLITDAYSRKVVGWDVSDNLKAINAIKALKQAIRQLPKGVVAIYHHSDRGIQYCSSKYVKLLKGRKIKISMTENGDPLENAIAERVNGILKTEWIYGQEVMQSDRVRTQIRRIVKIYNNNRPHLSIEMLTPSEAHEKSGKLDRKWKNYYNKKETQGKKTPVA